jgi:putative phosphoesterase
MIAVISDIHDNIPNLNTALTIAKENKVSALFVLGDITNADTLKYLAANFSEPIYLVSGNMEVCDLEAESKKYPQINYLGRHGGIIEIAGRKIGLCHEPTLADALINQDATIIFYGHTHKPFEENKNGIKLINPGNLANVFYAPTFALWDEQTDKLELKIL